MILAGDVLPRQDDADRPLQLLGIRLDEGQGDRAGRLDHQALRLEQVTQRGAELNAVRPGLATTSGPLFMISSPYARRGELWRTYNKHFGPDGDPSILARISHTIFA